MSAGPESVKPSVLVRSKFACIGMTEMVTQNRSLFLSYIEQVRKWAIQGWDGGSTQISGTSLQVQGSDGP